MAKICLCLTGKTIKRNLEILNKYRKYTDIAELRVDCLDADERLYIRRFPENAGLPVILTIRRDVDGGFFSGGEGTRVKLFANGLAYANADLRHNFAYIDIENDFDIPSLEEAARTFGTRIIRSFHDVKGVMENIPEKMRLMKRSGDDIIKIAYSVKSTNDVAQIYNASKTLAGQDKVIICMGHYGIYSRILAEKFGSLFTYASALSENETPGAPGQMDVRELFELYRFRKITNKTKIYGLVGNPLKSSVSPWFFNTIFGLENLDAVYVPFPANSIDDFLELANDFNIEGLSVTVPYKEAVLPYLAKRSTSVLSIGACNTMFRSADGWTGENTDIGGFSTSLLEFIDKKNLKRKKITIIGAGGVARAVASEVYQLGGKALILNRSIQKAKELASQYNFKWAGLDSQGIEGISRFNDIIIQTTSVGMEGHDDKNPLELYEFTGKEDVMDLIYTPAETMFLKKAAAAGCRTINGYNMVIRQACLQYSNFIGNEIPPQLLLRINTMGENTWNKIRSG